MPSWAQQLSVRAMNTLLWYGPNELTHANVRRLGRAHFAQFHNVGRVTLEELRVAIGGWDTPDIVWPPRVRP